MTEGREERNPPERCPTSVRISRCASRRRARHYFVPRFSSRAAEGTIDVGGDRRSLAATHKCDISRPRRRYSRPADTPRRTQLSLGEFYAVRAARSASAPLAKPSRRNLFRRHCKHRCPRAEFARHRWRCVTLPRRDASIRENVAFQSR